MFNTTLCLLCSNVFWAASSSKGLPSLSLLLPIVVLVKSIEDVICKQGCKLGRQVLVNGERASYKWKRTVLKYINKDIHDGFLLTQSVFLVTLYPLR